MKDYETPPNSLLPKWNQQNLGLGVAEAEWEQLTVGMQRALSEGVIEFFNKCVLRDEDESDHGTEKEHELIQRKEYTAKFNEMLNSEEKALSRFSDEDVRKIWDRQNEDGRKFLYGDIAQIPWSDAHLHGGDLFEDNYDPEKHAAELEYRHPSTVGKKQGLHNVAGVHGNILLTPSVACDRYIKNLRSIFNIPEGEENFTFKFRGLPDTYNSKDVAEEFTAKHQNWYENAYDNHQPIIGGMSGHTLAYLNLYRAAVNKIQDESFDGPSLETIRTIMLAALVGNKRHHSYNEVMSASVGLKFDRDEKSELTYKDRVGYSDILKSPEFKDRKLDKKVVKKAEDAYIELKKNTVLSIIREHLDKQEDEERLKTLVSQYFQDLASGESEKIYKTKEDITEFIKKSMDRGGAKDESSDGHI